MTQERAKRVAIVGALIMVLVALLALPGCGLQTEEANKALANCMNHQAAAEAALAKIKNFPAEWAAVFAGPLTVPQVAAGRQLIAAREADAQTFATELKMCVTALKPVSKMNVDEKVKEFVKLKLAAYATYEDYVTKNLQPLLKSYEGLVEQIAYSRPQAEINQSAAEINTMASEAQAKLEDAVAAAQRADTYFKNNKLGK